MRVGYLGPAGTYTEEALRASAPPDVEEVPFPTIYDTVMAVHDGKVDRAVVPIENALEGAVSATIDTLALDATDVRIVAEVDLPIHHCVVAAAELDLDEVKRVVSHPQATAQCRRFLRERLPGAEVVVAPSTADAVLSVRDSVGVEAFDAQLRQPVELVDGQRLAHGEHHRDPLGQQPPGDEGQHLRGRAVEPVGVFDQAHERARLGRFGEQAEHRQGHEKAVRRVALLQPEGHAQRVLLGSRQIAHPVQQRRAQVMQPRERQLHLGLHAGGARHAALGRLLGEILEQDGLADPGLAPQHQHRALAHAHALQQAVQRGALGAAVVHHRGLDTTVRSSLIVMRGVNYREPRNRVACTARRGCG
jgi:hypothetical protein